MMKSLRTIVTVMAIANLLALLGFVGWLHMTDRLDLERVERVREIFSETRAEQEAREEEERREADRLAREQEEAIRAGMPPLTAEDVLDRRRGQNDVAAQALQRLKREVTDLQRTLRREREALDARIAEFEREKEEFNSMRQRLASIEAGEQFKKTVTLYESLPADKAQALMAELLASGKVEQVVSYLNAMQSRSAKKIVERFEDPSVAADLLERLRTRGLQASVPEDE